MIVVVVIPFAVVETSLTTVLDELPLPPDPELPPADCEDEVDEVADVDDVDDVDDVAEVDDVDDFDEDDEDDVAALEGVAVTAAAEEAIALIDMKTSPEGTCGRSIDCGPCSPLQRGEGAKQAHQARKKRRRFCISAPQTATNRRATSCRCFPPVRMARDQPAVGSRSP
ncbi:hypothetical protein [Bradyrhizobium sp. CCGUVB14]|uniref:hypothetical protein n=1 Tax=Bradyrhizobium sp. CCGUVB14 TaxID=2949628 RepID=UPI0020B3546D|nr:hypothetical protein [Bradyrhizobium sp. CCGUVB14]MCP3444111.1 hypothetical protein [Bradyrhizobium sp. CCGUVB14]